MTISPRHISCYSCRSSFIAAAILIVSNSQTQAQGQVSSLQQLPPSSNNQSQPSSNAIDKLFSNPASSYASLYANPNTNSPYGSIEGVPKGDFWGGLFHRHIVDAGTVLNGTLEDDISSKTSKIGDIFSILLTNGYTSNNEQLIPAYTKIVGTIVAVTPAKQTKNGVAGSVQINLQTLVLPDSTSMPISASVQYNPNQPKKFDITKGRGIPIGEYAQSFEYSAVSAAGSFTRQLGFPLPYKTQTGGGPDFVVKQGELLPVKLTQPLDMTTYVSSHPSQAASSQAQTTSNQTPNTTGSTTVLPINNGSLPGLTRLPANESPTIGPIYQEPWPGNQPLPSSSNNTLPGNSAPAGPDPF